MRIYLAGPMRGYPEFNFPKFMKFAAMLRERGHTVFNPAERDIERHNGVDVSKGNMDGCEQKAATDHKFSMRDALRDDLVYITQEADAIYLMHGWQNSKGVNAELAVAEALGLIVLQEDIEALAGVI